MTSQITKSEVHAIVLFIALCAGLLKQLQMDCTEIYSESLYWAYCA